MAVQARTVRCQQRAGLVLDHAVGEELDRVRGQQLVAGRLGPAALLGELGDLLVEVARIGVEGEVEPHPQGVLARGCCVGLDVGRLHPRVLHPRHPARRVVVGGGAQRRDADLLVAGRHDAHHQVGGAPFAQGAQHRTVLAVRDLAQRRVGGVGRDPGSLQGSRVAPQRVIVPGAQHDWTVGYRGVQPARVEQPVRGQAAVVGGADDPLVVGVCVGVTPHRGDDLVDRAAGPHGGADGLQAPVEGVGVTVAERRHQEAATQVDDVRVVSLRRPPGGGDDAVGDEQCVGVTVAGPDRAAGEQRRAHLTTAVCRCPAP